MIQKICYFLAVIFFAAGTLLMGDLGGLARALRSYYLRAEPFFLPPVDLREGTVVVRTDRYGKGYFGASRNGGRKHAGVDLIAPIKGPVRAAKSGRIVRSAEERGYGKHVYILHPDRSVTR
ncbi:MAG: M23 family metallopeptidase, partial [Candidatus Omnitrophota bacterium]